MLLKTLKDTLVEVPTEQMEKFLTSSLFYILLWLINKIHILPDWFALNISNDEAKMEFYPANAVKKS